jgi:hypothetical protein
MKGSLAFYDGLGQCILHLVIIFWLEEIHLHFALYIKTILHLLIIQATEVTVRSL